MLKQALDEPPQTPNPAFEQGTLANQKKLLRARIRQQRNALSPKEQKLATRQLMKQISQSKLLLRHQYIALYLGNDGELNPEALIPQLIARKKKVFLPVIHPLNKHTLCFCEYTKTTRLKANRFGIKEPVFALTKRIQRQFLSLVFMPLVAFDIKGNRMGMGGGFYDRSFAYKHQRRSSKPGLMGLAHSFQEQAALPVEPWDVPLDGILTDQRYYRFDCRESAPC